MGKRETFEELAERLKKEYSGISLGTLPLREYHQTGYPSLDEFLRGGLLKGGLYELFGPPSCGKTTVALAIAASYRNKGVLYIDADQAVGDEDIERAGIDRTHFLYYRSPFLEDVMKLVFDACSKQLGLVVIDSIASLTPVSELKANKNMAKVAAVAPIAGLYSRKLGILLHKLQAYGMTALFVNQDRAKIGATGYQNPYAQKGGYVLKSVAHARLEMWPSLVKDEGSKQYVALSTRIVYAKNKLGPPTGACTVELVPGHALLEAGGLKQLQQGKQGQTYVVEVVDADDVEGTED